MFSQEEWLEVLAIIEDLTNDGYTEDEATDEAVKIVLGKREQKKKRSVPIAEYISVMDLSEEEEEDIKAKYQQMFDMMIFIFSVIQAQKITGSLNYLTIASTTVEEYQNIVGSDENLDRHISYFADNLAETTIKHIDDPWYLSEDRAMFIAENEAVSNYDYKKYIDAKLKGATHKRWVAEIDKATRDTHKKANGKVVPIDSLFRVGKAKMMFPKDDFTEESTGFEHPEEIVNCRCYTEYIGGNIKE